MSDNIVEQKLKRRGAVLTLVVDSHSGAARPSTPTGEGAYRALYARGLLWTDSGLVSLDNAPPPDLNYRTARDHAGQWFVLFHSENDNSYRCVTDVMGYCRLYYSSFRRGDDQVVVLGDNQSSVVGELQRLGRSVNIDWPIAAAHLLSTHTIMQSSFSHRTMFAGVRALPAGADLIIDRDGAREEHQHLFAAPSGARYEDLLQAGIARAQEQIRHLASSPVADKRHALSGGRDSRMAMALTVSAGVHKEFTMMTADPRSSRRSESRKVLEQDLIIASELRRYLGLKWSRESGIAGIRHDVHTSLDIFQSHNAGARFTWTGNAATTWPSSLRLEVHGASGELLRRAYQNMRTHRSFTHLDDRADTLTTDARRLFPTLVTHHSYMPGDLAEEAAAAFDGSLDHDWEAPMSEQLNLHYAAFRNRDHFGQLNQRFAKNALVAYPLAQPEFLQASRLIAPNERAQGRVAFDIIRMTHPELNEFAFDDGHWPKPFPLASTDRKHGPTAFDPSAYRNFFEEEDADTKLRAATRMLTDPKRPVAPFDGLAAAGSLAASSASELSDFADTPVPDLATLIPTLIAQGGLAAGNTASKLETMTTVFTGRCTPYDSVFVTAGRAQGNAIISDAGAWHTESPSPVRIARDEPLVFHIDIETQDDEGVVTIRCNSTGADSVEWAIYLYRERTKIAQRWYDDARSARFSLTDVPKNSRIRALVFTREKGASGRVHRKFSTWCTV